MGKKEGFWMAEGQVDLLLDIGAGPLLPPLIRCFVEVGWALWLGGLIGDGFVALPELTAFGLGEPVWFCFWLCLKRMHIRNLHACFITFCPPNFFLSRQ